MKLHIPKTLTFKVVLSAGIAVLCSSFVMMAIIQAIVSSFYKEEIGFQVNQKTKQVSTLLDDIAAKSKVSLGVAQVDFKLANSILLATYTRNPDEVVGELKSLGQQMGFTFFQIVDALGNIQATSETSNLPIKPGDHSVGAEILESSSALPIIASTGPIELYGENIGTVTIGYYLDKTLMDNIADGSGVDIAYFDGDRLVTASVNFKASDTTRMALLYGGTAIKTSSGHKFQIAVETTRYHSTLMKLILWTVLITFMAILATVLVLWKVMRNNFIDHFKSLLSSVTKRANLIKNNQSEALLPVPDTSETVEFSQLTYAINTLIDKVGASSRQLVEASKHAELGKLSTQVAHDICSPLSSLKAASEMLRKHVAGSREAMDALNLLQLSGQRLEGIANGLLARHKGGASDSKVFSIHEVLDELVGEMQASPLGNGVQFIKHYNSGALYVSGDKTGIARALGNIIKNALEAMEQNGGDRVRCLTVGTALVSPSPQPSPLKGEGVIVRITDTGHGIPADKIPLILQGGHSEGKADGHGIGTRVVREVIDAHKGTLNIESEVGRGTTFMITLPLSAPIEDAATGTTVTIPYSGSGAIHVIDDEPSMREQWRLTLKAHGLAAVTYQSWEEYEGAMHPLTPALTTFIIDYHFDNSEVDGLEVIRRLKGRGFSTFVLATAEYWKPAIKAAAVELGITICPKPLPRVVVQAASPPQSASIVNGGSVVTPITGSPLTLNPIAGMTNLGVTKEAGPSVLVIDDDSSIHLSWKMMRTTLGVGKLTLHSNLEEMIAAATNPAQFDLCVIDKNIEGSQFDGAHTLDYLRNNGARSVVLASGETEGDIRKDPRFNSADGILKSKVPMSSDELDRFLN